MLHHARAEYLAINRDAFRSALTVPTFRLSDDARKLGTWQAKSRTLTLSRPLIRAGDWLAVIEVLRHEMAHQYVTEVLRVTDESPHGPAFQRVCAERGIDPRATGLPDASPTDAPSKVTQRIRALLALADSPNEHEARAAARKAYTLMHKHNVAQSELGGARYQARRIGPVKSRMMAWEKSLVALLGQHFFVSPLIVPVLDVSTGKASKTVEFSGTPENLDMAEHVYDWLVATGDRLYREYKRSGATRGRGDRQRFLLGLINGFRQQLDDQKRVVQETGLVWVGDPELTDWRNRRHGRIRAARAGTFRPTAAYHSGVQQGQDLQLNRPVRAKPTARGRRLTDKGNNR